jgi:hypothetical protein
VERNWRSGEPGRRRRAEREEEEGLFCNYYYFFVIVSNFLSWCGKTNGSGRWVLQGKQSGTVLFLSTGSTVLCYNNRKIYCSLLP